MGIFQCCVHILIFLGWIVQGLAPKVYPSGCVDMAQFCYAFARFGICEKNMAITKMQCDQSCGYCSEVECDDKAKYIDCESLSQDECIAHASFYQSRCKASCNWCEKAKSWMTWGEWSKCPTGCKAAARRRRRRRCLVKPCSGPARQVEKCPNNCGTWGDWNSWSVCSASCGKGETTRERQCFGGSECKGEPSEINECEISACETKAQWGKWEPWSPCRATCGDSVKLRIRTCLTGSDCKGRSIGHDACKIKDCPSAWGDWNSWSVCSASCGKGETTRERQCVDGSVCEGEPREAKECEISECEAKAQWGEWDTWSPCRATCGESLKLRKRTCLTGSGCKGDRFEVDSCKIKDCPTNWGPWGEWSECSETCGDGFRRKFRNCTVEVCESGEPKQAESCRVKYCPAWSDWSSWSLCSVRCGKGVKFRDRSCVNGPGCEGKNDEVSSCELPSCSGEGPQFDIWTDCTKTCGGGTRHRLKNCPERDINICPLEYEHCNTFNCRKIFCDRSEYFRENSNHTRCCEQETSECGRNKRTRRRVIGGTVTTTDQYPWVVRITPTKGNLRTHPNWVCTGSLIHPRFVVTAAHCGSKDSADRLWRVKDLVVTLGANTINDKSPLVQKITLADIIIHPEYNYPLNDIALLMLKKSAKITERVNTICMPNGEETPEDERCTAAGWGVRRSGDAEGSTELLKVTLNHLPYGACFQLYRDIHEMDEKMMLCGGVLSGGKDTCQGDSGGPFMCQRCSSCAWYLAGVTSFGATNCGEEGKPAVYVKVNNYQEWIADTVELSEDMEFSC